jgi:putative zinc finger/helix-turn-helix YgiT family protein
MAMTRRKKQCPECGKEMVLKRYKHETPVGGLRAIDGTQMAFQCDACGEVEITVDQLQGYERRAAALVLRDGRVTNGAVLRFSRKALGLTQAQLAQLLGIASETVSRWENDHDPPNRPHQLAIVSLLEGVETGMLDLQEALSIAGADRRSAPPAQLEVREPRSVHVA